MQDRLAEVHTRHRHSFNPDMQYFAMWLDLRTIRKVHHWIPRPPHLLYRHLVVMYQQR